jgi:hypothetical protein
MVASDRRFRVNKVVINDCEEVALHAVCELAARELWPIWPRLGAMWRLSPSALKEDFYGSNSFQRGHQA